MTSSTSWAVLGLLPWVVLGAYAALWVRFPRRLPPARGSEKAPVEPPVEPPVKEPVEPPVEGPVEPPIGSSTEPPSATTFPPARELAEEDLPFVSVIVPARDEADAIVACLESLAASHYPRFEVVVVDDRSEDGTGTLARGVTPGSAERIMVLDGAPLPDGWLGKPWACRQGFVEARGDLLLFTDADTVHGPDLLERAVRGLREEGPGHGIGGVTVMGRQRMETFWEKVVQPQIFVLLALRFSRLDRRPRPGRCRDAVANGQFILVRREAYEAVGGHEAVRDEVVEDLRLAQILCRRGSPLAVREAEDELTTRMYRSLGHMVEGWTKNVAIGARQSLPPRTGRVVLPIIAIGGALLWLVPPLVLSLTVIGTLVFTPGLPAAPAASAPGVIGPWLLWSAGAVALSVAFWMGASSRGRIHPLWGVFYPVGSALALFIFLRSWARGGRVEWKGRRYEVGTDADAGGELP